MLVPLPSGARGTARRHLGPGTVATAVVTGLASTLAACGSAGSGFSNARDLPEAPSSLTATASGTDVTLSWTTVPGADSYTLYWSTTAGFRPQDGSALPAVTSPFVHGGRNSGVALFYVVTATNAAGEGPASAEVRATPPAVHAPAWAGVPPVRVVHHAYDSARTEVENGALLRAAIGGLRPGDRLEVAAGRYSIAPRFAIALGGSPGAPIWIVGAAGAVLTRPDANQNTVNVDYARFVALQGFEVTGGDTAVKLYDCSEFWLDGCHVHHCGGVAVAANSQDTDHLWLTRNEIHDTSGSGGEGMYLGANNGQFVTHHSVVADNHVHHCRGTQGDGIELKQGSWANLIVGNHVHDTNYPCILVYGTAGREPNVVERNVCYRSNDNVLQVQGEAVVRNNLVIGGTAGFHSHDHQGMSRDLVFTHNTVLSSGRGANLQSWNGRPGMVFANNVVYSESGDALRFAGGASGVSISGNVVVGTTAGTGAAFLHGAGLVDFEGASFDGSARDVRPRAGSPLRGAADPAFAAAEDLTGQARLVPFSAGCREP